MIPGARSTPCITRPNGPFHGESVQVSTKAESSPGRLQGDDHDHVKPATDVPFQATLPEPTPAVPGKPITELASQVLEWTLIWKTAC